MEIPMGFDTGEINNMRYVLGIDQSTQGTKAILVDEVGRIAGRADVPHAQIVNDAGWVSHDLNEIYANVLRASADVIAQTGIDPAQIACTGISNQRETTAMWGADGEPLAHAVVWQCARAASIAEGLAEHADLIRERTGLELSPYFPAAKMAWLLRNVPAVQAAEETSDAEAGSAPAENGGAALRVMLGTIDSWLIWKLTGGVSFKTDYSNASRTQLFDIHRLCWDEEICALFGVPVSCLPEVCMSDADFGRTDLEGLLPAPVPIHGVMGDSHAALYGQGCHRPGMTKTTYGTGSSIMMNIGPEFAASAHGLVTSLAWGRSGRAEYVFEGNINYTGAVIAWLKNDVKLIESAAETADAAAAANPADRAVLVPAFSGLNAPYWDNNARAALVGMSRTTGRNEIIRAGVESIALQIDAVLRAMQADLETSADGMRITELRVDGGPTKNPYLMQFQSDISDVTVAVSAVEELSAIGSAYMAGIAAGLLDEERLFAAAERVIYQPRMNAEARTAKIADWDEAVRMVRGR